jgi:hypothetical protein
VIRSHFRSRYNRPSSIIPQRGNFASNSGPSASSDCWHVFQEEEAGSNVASKPDDLEKKTAALSFQSCSKSCNANILAGEAACNDIHHARPGGRIECGDVVPDWRVVEVSAVDSLLDELLREPLDFDIADRSHPRLQGVADPADTGK